MTNKNTKNLNAKKPSFVSETPAQKKEARSFCITPMMQKIMPWCIAALFAVLAAYYLIEKNSDLLFMYQEKNIFYGAEEYFQKCMGMPGGLLVWVSTYLTQYFYYPALGASILIAIWLLIFAASKYAFNIRNAWMAIAVIPLVCLLCSEIMIGYWVYYLKFPGYTFTSTLGLLSAMIAVIIFRLISDDRIRLAWMIVWAAAGIFLIGWMSWVGTIYMAIVYFFSIKEKTLNRWIIPAVAVALAIAMPLAAHSYYSTYRIETAWYTVLPVFWSNLAFTFKLEIPFIIMAAMPLTYVIFANGDKSEEVKGAKAWASILSVLAVCVASFFATKKINVDDYNYHAEMRMTRAVNEQRWNDVLTDIAGVEKDATREMILFKNIALMNTGHLGDMMFKYNNMSEMPYVFDSLEVHMVQTGAPLIYYHHGKTNFSYRWAVENCVEYGFSITNLRILAKCSIINGEYKVAKKYLEILKKTKFHKEWAERYDDLIYGRKTIGDYPEFNHVMEIYSHMGTTLDGDNGLCEMYLLNYFSNTMNKDSKELQEMTLIYSLVQKDIPLFWPRFFLYSELHKGEEMPIHYQEAAFLYGNLEPDNVDIRRMPFDQVKVVDRYEGFTKMSQEFMKQLQATTGNVDTKKVGEMMKPYYGDTFYWFYFFCRDIQSY